MSRPIGGSPRVPGTRAMVPAPMMLMLLMMCACFPDGAERASRAGEPGWVPASDELFGARPACEGGAGGDSARAWHRLGTPADYPAPGSVRCYCHAAAASVRPARAGAPETRLPEPGLQGAQQRVVHVLAQPACLLGGQAQRVPGLGKTARQQLGLGQQPERER